MMAVTIGQASGLIALAVFAIQILLPLSIVIVLVSSLRNEHNAVTWSVVGRTVQSSLWPAILRTDSVSSRKVSTRVFVLSWSITLSLLLLAVAGVLTPLGLTDAIKAGGQATAHFVYVPDLTGYGYGTPPRYNRFSRLCGAFLLLNCPGRDDGYDFKHNSTGIYGTPRNDDAYLNSTIPANVTEVFQSGSSKAGSTLSGPFDIQYRTWSVRADKYEKLVDRGAPYAAGTFRNLGTLILNNKIEALEGLVVDSVHGGVGFRNHSVPTGFEQGVEWTEDLTWITPVTSCVDTNLSFVIQIGDRETNVTGMSLVDDGGFADLPRLDPFDDELYASQDVNLYNRAYKGAFRSNGLAMLYFNVSFPGNKGPRNTERGKNFPLPQSYTAPLSAIHLSGIDGRFLDLATSVNTNTTGLNISATAAQRLQVSSQNFTYAAMACQGFGGSDQANISNIGIQCGYLFGAPRRQDGSNLLVFEPEQNYTQNMYTCASAVQASVKTVKFSINGTGSLANLRVDSVTDKVYPDEASKPLWAVEKTGLNISDLQLLWGMVDNTYEHDENLYTLRRDKLWLPATSLSMLSSIDSVASSNAPSAALTTAFTGALSGGIDYTGETNIALNRLWKEYSKSAATAGNIINLITSDIMAASMVGTKSAIIRTDSPAIPRADNSGDLPPNAAILVSGYRRQVQYRWVYAIPAFIITAFVGAMVLLALVVWITRRFHFTMLKQLLNQTSTGRTVTNILYPELCDSQASTSEWVEKAGASHLAFAVVPKQSALSPSGSLLSGRSMAMHPHDGSLSRGSSTLRFGSGGERKAPLYRVLSQTDIRD